MGSSVFHGGFSTFLAIILTAPSKSYVFIIFFRLWFSIILFGMTNGFMLLPVILTFIGPTYGPSKQSPKMKETDSKNPAVQNKDKQKDQVYEGKVIDVAKPIPQQQTKQQDNLFESN